MIDFLVSMPLSLPLKVIAEIFSHLDKNSKILARSVCLRWCGVLDRFFLKASVLLTNLSVTSVSNCSEDLHIETLKIRNLTRRLPNCQTLSLSRNLLAKNPKNLILVKKSTKNLKRASVSRTNLKKLLLLNRNIELLHFDFNSLALSEFTCFRELYFKNLKQLKICITPREEERRNLVHLSMTKLPVLEVLQILAKFQADRAENGLFYIDVYKFVAKHKSTLKVLNIIHPICVRRFRPSDPPLLPPDQMESLRDSLNQLNLRMLYLNFDKNEGLGDYQLGFHLVQCQRSLRTLHLNFRENRQLAAVGMNQVFTQNAGSLSIVNIIANKRMGQAAPFGHHLDTLSLCKKLEHLRIVNFSIPALPPRISSTLKSLLVWGELSGVEILSEVKNSFPSLEQLDFLDLGTILNGNWTLENKLKSLLNMRHLKKIHWHKNNFNIRAAIEESPTVKIEPFVIYSSWSWPLKRTLLVDAHLITIKRSGAVPVSADQRSSQELREE